MIDENKLIEDIVAHLAYWDNRRTKYEEKGDTINIIACDNRISELQYLIKLVSKHMDKIVEKLVRNSILAAPDEEPYIMLETAVDIVRGKEE